MPKFWRGVAVVALAGGLVGAVATVPAVAASGTGTYAITIQATSKLPKATGDTWVVYKGSGGYGKATIAGTVTGDLANDTAVLYEEPFGTTSFVSTGLFEVLAGSASGDAYTFKVQPLLETSYEVEVFTSPSTTPDITSTAVPVYVVPSWSGNLQKCRRPVCHERFRAVIRVPASAYKREVAKRWYFYFGIRLSPVREPRPPKYLHLDKHAKISKPRRVSAGAFTRTFSWSFRIGNDGYYFGFDICSKATESKDGLGLPGHHRCGDPRIRNAIYPLGGPNDPLLSERYRAMAHI